MTFNKKNNIEKRQIIKSLILVFVAMMAVNTFAQDRLASIAPVDKRMRAVDSIAIRRYMRKENLTNPASSLYPIWNNEYTTHYGVALPSQYKIDLRGFHMPCDSRLVTSHFGYRAAFHRNHYGTDIKVYIGDTIRATFSGKVRIVDYERKGYGNYVIIRHPNGLETVYGHMSKHLVTENQVVKAGDPIGLGGNTGRSTGSHLHFETRFLGQFIDPERLFDFVAQDVLADSYMFHSSGRGVLLADNNDIVGGESADELTEDQAQAQEKQDAMNLAEEKAAQKRARNEAALRTHIHKVKSGENLSTIAKKCHTTVDKLCRMNNISKTATLRIGQILKYS